MIDFLITGVLLSGLYFLFYRGYFFRWIMWSFGYYGLAITLNNVSWLQKAPLIAFDHPLPWSYMIALLITLAALITTKYSSKGK